MNMAPCEMFIQSYEKTRHNILKHSKRYHNEIRIQNHRPSPRNDSRLLDPHYHPNIDADESLNFVDILKNEL